jgi:hypothetical protein
VKSLRVVIGKARHSRTGDNGQGEDLNEPTIVRLLRHLADTSRRILKHSSGFM